ncbi:phosphoadenosine phosphosulfate reductase [Chryseotalea sanaruensis]|uniref:Phosphoadenosine phosphosulfate reductase n=1 Tax=Chryseotalea sanaruensis TaxID=2482724 RepID=A0A401UE95_9BACT|nr:phosphoadenosine phosphosulfate reductase family protein [Chryseotalea sanaruensis]GCC53219.1 phosphoadenosine phosphosulfate reductase [Chryseotalea sanaruensis]
MSKVRHVLGISGGKDSAALAIYMKSNYPEINIEYYTSDTGKELDETYKLIENLEIFLGKKIVRLRAFKDSPESPFDHRLKMVGGYLPSQTVRWCTKSLKLDVFEEFVGDDPVISYVGIRGDENREGYISRKANIQSIFPFRKNIWSEDVVSKLLSNSNIDLICSIADEVIPKNRVARFKSILEMPITLSFDRSQKLSQLFDLGIIEFNELVFKYLKTTSYPLGRESNFALLRDENDLKIEDIFKILNESGVGVPGYYNEIPFEIDGKKSTYYRSRSGCFFCFYQRKIEWVWLYEQHPEKFKLAMEYEKDGYTWNDDESLAELSKVERIKEIKESYIEREKKAKKPSSKFLLDILAESDSEGCASCFT